MEDKKTFLMFCCILLAIVAFGMVTGIDTCVFRGITGIPCPTCGLTRAWLCVFSGRFPDAFHYHPLFFMVPFAPLPLLKVKGKGLSADQRNNCWIILIGIFALVWVGRFVV